MKIELTGEYHQDCNKLMERITELESSIAKVLEAWEISCETGFDEYIDDVCTKLRDGK